MEPYPVYGVRPDYGAYEEKENPYSTQAKQSYDLVSMLWDFNL